MVGRKQFGRVDCRLRQAFPNHAQDTLGGVPAILFGDFAQLPPVGDVPLFSSKITPAHHGLSTEGFRAYHSFDKSITLQTIFWQAGDDPIQAAFRTSLLDLRTYSTTEEDYQLLSTRFWEKLSQEERNGFVEEVHLLPTRESVLEYNCHRLAAIGKPVVWCNAIHKQPEAAKASEEDAEGLEKTIFLSEGATVMITRNLWTSKGIVFILFYQ